LFIRSALSTVRKSNGRLIALWVDVAYGTSRHFAAMQQFSRFLSEADIQRAAIAEPDL
jgi:hypothetical protein